MWSRIKAALVGLTVLALGAWQPACACAHDHHPSAAPAAHHAADHGDHGASTPHAHAAPAHHASIAADQPELGCATDAPLCDHSDKQVVTAKASSGDTVQSFAKTPAPSAIIVRQAAANEVFLLARTQATLPRLRPPPQPTPITLKVRQLA